MIKVDTLKLSKVLAVLFFVGLPFVSLSDTILKALLVIGGLLTVTLTIEINKYMDDKYGTYDFATGDKPSIDGGGLPDVEIVRYTNDDDLDNFSLGYTYHYTCVERCEGMPSLFQLVETSCHYESMVEFDLDGLITIQVFQDGSVNMFDFSGLRIAPGQANKIRIDGDSLVPSIILALILETAEEKLNAREEAMA